MSSLDPARAWLAAGITGLARGKEWDVVATAEAPGAPGDEVVFLALPDGRLRAETEWDGDLRPLADALAGEIEPPFRALARRLADLWAVGAVAIDIRELSEDPDGDAVEIARTEEGVSVRIDDVPTARPLPELERLGEARAATYVVRATRVEGRLFEVEVEPL
ncbi:MAG: hypothetical protein KatS3mg012_1385 [Gaiellaceae bacterium]|jgi:hypothetical protein|nr:MAG: hypothetical protein KatS3mg012_1385 [Gaiellaceae bacterium]